MGPPGTGKGTLAQVCQKQFGWNHISTGALCREYAQRTDDLGQQIAQRIDNGFLIENSLMMRMLEDSLSQKKNNNSNNSLPVILDGFPRTIEQVDLLTGLFQNNKQLLFVFFDATEDVVIQRLRNRIVCSNSLCDKIYSVYTALSMTCPACGSQLIKRKDDSEAIIYNRLKIYYSTADVLKQYIFDKHINYIELNAELSKQDIFDKFIFLYNQKMSILKINSHGDSNVFNKNKE
jgi:adenylate kinase